MIPLGRSSGTHLAFSNRIARDIMKKLATSVIIILAFVALTGVAQAGQVTTNPVNPVPDAGATSALMGIAIAGLAAARRFLR
jgi:hypothetical protein